jgi:LCP family protein required for cell wall assembly
MIASVNTKNHTVLLTSIPRDLYLKVAGYEDGRYEKLSFMNINYGYELNRESLAQFLDTKIDYTILINTDSLVTVVDYVGGIDFCSDYEFMTTHALVKDTYNDVGKKLYVKKGCQHLNGIETLTVARERNSFPGRDRVRQENCRKILVEIIKKLISTDTIIHYNETLNTLSSLYETDIDEKIITNFAKDILANGNKWQIESQSIDGMDGKDRVHKGNAIDWVMYPDEATVRQAQENIKKALN